MAGESGGAGGSVTHDMFEWTGDEERDTASVQIITFFEGLRSLHGGDLATAEFELWLADMDGQSLGD